MATILFSAAGAALGGGIGGTVLGLSGAVIGRAVGATVGRMVDQRLIGLGSDAVEVGKMDRFHIMGASEGAPIAKCWGRMRLPGQVIWASPFVENRRKTGGKGMPSPRTAQYSYSVSLAIALCEGEILGVGRIWADGDEISSKNLNLRVYTGTGDQLPDPGIEAALGQGRVPAYRGIAYVVIENLELSVFGSRVPQFSFEVMRRGQGTEAEKVSDLQQAVRAVSLIPGTGEYALASKKQHEEQSFGVGRKLNVNSSSGEADITTSLKQLRQELPNCKAVSLVVSWFGSDLRCGFCTVEPKVEQKITDSVQMPWTVGGISRDDAKEIPRREGRSIFGGTPADSAVIQAIHAIKENQQEVMFYPFILVDIINDNGLPDPYSHASTQPSLPWRGRITLSSAPGMPDSSDKTAAAELEVASFFGSAQVQDFSIHDEKINYNGPSEWKYRRFILHYAHLCKLAGGVESFCIGSEMRGLTQIRGENHTFPAVRELIELSKDVRTILGADTKISYAADWSEYFGYHFDGNVYFNLDPLWASPEIDFVGIDNYMPLSDWRSEDDHADIAWRSIYNLEYLKSNILGAEGFDWYYDSKDGREGQCRVPIVDGAYGEHWIFRYKDIKSWWSHFHYNRVDGIRSNLSTDWNPKSKPIRFTEYGCPAIDKGTNEPNRFIDDYSSESMAPHSSILIRDDFIQMQYFRAHWEFWGTEENNPISDRYLDRMLDLDHCFAWAWDARPFPSFPRNLELWSDGINYDRGHWINGRSTNVPLDRVAREICQRAGLTDIDTTYLYGLVHGYSIDETQSARSQTQPLATVHNFDCIEAEGSLKFLSRGVVKEYNVSSELMVVGSNSSFEIERTRLSDYSAVERVRFACISSDGNFTVEVAEASDIKAAAANTLDAEYMMAVPMDDAKMIAAMWLAESQVSREQIVLSLPYSEIALRPGDVIEIERESYRIDSCEISESILISAVKVDRSVYERMRHSADQRHWKSNVKKSVYYRFWLDLPLINADQSSFGPYIVVSSYPWEGPVIVWSGDDDLSYDVSAVIEGSTHFGRTLSDLSECQSCILDRGPALRIELNFGELSSIDLLGLLAGKNLIAVGDGSVENWEIFQFQDAVLVAPGVYEISTRIRGRFGTENNILFKWPIGSFVVILDASIRRVPFDVEMRNVERHYRIGSLDEGVESDDLIHDIVAFKGLGLRPYTVAHPKLEKLSDGSHFFSWIRRARVGGDSWEGYDVPLQEENELYSFSVISSEEVTIRNCIVERPSFTYLPSLRVEDAIGDTYFVEISQISLQFGAGPSTKLFVSGSTAFVFS